jgi:sugar lactone lactonase YvrE
MGDVIIEATAAASALNGTMNSVPSPDGQTIYFTAMTEDGGAVHAVPAGGGASSLLTDTLVLPVDLVVSADGGTLFVVDTGVEDAEGRGSAIRRVPAAGGDAVTIETTLGFDPRGVELAVDAEGGAEHLYFSGRDEATGHGGVFRLDLPADAVETVVISEELVDPSGLAVTEGGDVYVADTVGAGESGVFRVTGEGLERLEIPYRLGFPAGLAIAGGTLLISAQHPTTGNAAVVAYDLASGLAVEKPEANVNGNPEAGGLHRALAAEVFSWCGVTADGSTTVYRISLR